MAKNKFKLEIITPHKQVLDEEVDYMMLRTTQGDMGVLYDHEPVVALLEYGAMRYKQGDLTKCVTIMGGFAEIKPDKVVILTDASEFPKDIDLDRAKKAQQKAQDLLKQQNIDRLKVEIALKKALVRLHVKETQT